MDELAERQKALEILDSHNLSTNLTEKSKTITVNGTNSDMKPFDFAILAKYLESGLVIDILTFDTQKLENIKLEKVTILTLNRMAPAKFESEFILVCDKSNDKPKKI